MRSARPSNWCEVAFAAALLAGTIPLFGSLAIAQVPSAVLPNLDALNSQPASHMGYTFDRSQLQAAQGVIESAGLPSERAAAALTSLSFDTYRYKEPAFYTPEAMTAILHAYQRAGWKHLVEANASPAESAQPHSSIIDLWLHFKGADIDHVAVLIRSERDMNFIQVAGDLRPLDLLHLGGHFGIPKVDPNAVMVPAPDGR
ncbi:MAG: hypothetical protein M3O02_13460 [Acidobacteriota bacterium]|nr:hypothetical protein [Acidobacteriota bacterium]